MAPPYIHRSISGLTTALSLCQVVPHYYLSVDLDLTELLALRGRLNGTIKAGSGGRELSVLDFLVKAAALAMKQVGQGAHSGANTLIQTFILHAC